jgi:histidyl-tRNA synthetase
MNDVLPEQAPYWARLEREAQSLFKAYGYTRLRMPVLERTELFSRSIGELTDIVDKEMYTFTDRSGDSVTMRPEATAGVVRAGLSNGLLHNQAQKFWCSGPMFRHERPQKGRYRQFHQLSVEALGFAEPEIDAELIVLSSRLWQSLGLKDLKLEVNSLGTPEARAGYKTALVDYFSKHSELLDGDSQRRLERNPLRILDSKSPAMQPIVAAAPVLTDYLDDESRAHFDTVKDLLADVGVSCTINPRLVRGLDYYSRTVFEWITGALGAQSAVCSGGRYDGLVEQLGGRPTPAVGWALGVERVVELMQQAGTDVESAAADVCFVSVGEAARRRSFALAETLRRAAPALSIVLAQPAASLKAQLKRADRLGARYAVIIGEDELAAGDITLKPLLDRGDQERIGDSALIERLKNSVRPVQ